MSVPREVLDRDMGLSHWCLFHGYRGSIAHGMYEPPSSPTSTDDKDTVAVCRPDTSYYCGIGIDSGRAGGKTGPYYREYGSKGTKEIKEGEWDVVVYEVRKALWLSGVGNPNMLSILWLPERYTIATSDEWEGVLENRRAFVGRHVYKSFVGYAKAQLAKMERGSSLGYMGEKRKRLVEQFGYDCKNASHLIRLLRMAAEFLRDGELVVDRGGYDAPELLAIKHGEWPLERVKSEAERLFRRAEDAHDRSTLPAGPDWERINDLCVWTVSRSIR